MLYVIWTIIAAGGALLVGGLLNILPTVISTFLFAAPAPTSAVWTSVKLLVKARHFNKRLLPSK